MFIENLLERQLGIQGIENKEKVMKNIGEE
jgi:hypothetical protein